MTYRILITFQFLKIQNFSTAVPRIYLYQLFLNIVPTLYIYKRIRGPSQIVKDPPNPAFPSIKNFPLRDKSLAICP